MDIQRRVVEHAAAHVANEAHADGTHLLVVLLDWIERVVKVLWHLRAEARDRTRKAAVVLDRHHARHNRHRDARRTHTLDPVSKDV